MKADCFRIWLREKRKGRKKKTHCHCSAQRAPVPVINSPWSAPAERSGDDALVASLGRFPHEIIQGGVRYACHRAPNSPPGFKRISFGKTNLVRSAAGQQSRAFDRALLCACLAEQG